MSMRWVKNKMARLVIVGLAGIWTVTGAMARDYISIVGSSTVYPFATVVAERFGKSSGFRTPKIESTGTGGGMKLFCSGVGTRYPDITNASRRMKPSEQAYCAKQGVDEVVEVKIGYDGVAIANTKAGVSWSLSFREIFLALAKQIPGPNGRLIDNPYQHWKAITPSLPDNKIEVLGPPPTSGTRDAFVELVMEAGAKHFPDLAALAKAKGKQQVKPLMAKLGIPDTAYHQSGKRLFKQVAHAIREDGAYIEAGENDNLIVQKLKANPNALGIFGFSFLDQNADQVKGARIDGTAITFESIVEGRYPVSRPLYLYVKKAHVGTIPGLKQFLQAFTSDRAWGDEGYLADKGMIPMSVAERQQFANDVKQLNPMDAL